jgi:hypothetical protein
MTADVLNSGAWLLIAAIFPWAPRSHIASPLVADEVDTRKEDGQDRVPARHHPAAKAQRRGMAMKGQELPAGAALFFGATITDGEEAAYSSQYICGGL